MGDKFRWSPDIEAERKGVYSYCGRKEMIELTASSLRSLLATKKFNLGSIGK